MFSGTFVTGRRDSAGEERRLPEWSKDSRTDYRQQDQNNGKGVGSVGGGT